MNYIQCILDITGADKITMQDVQKARRLFLMKSDGVACPGRPHNRSQMTAKHETNGAITHIDANE